MIVFNGRETCILRYSGLVHILRQEGIWSTFIKCSSSVKKWRANISYVLNYKMSFKTPRPLWSLLANVKMLKSLVDVDELLKKITNSSAPPKQ